MRHPLKMVEVLWLGAFAYLFNSVSVFSVFLYPYAIQHCLILTIFMLPVFALLSYGASVVIIKLTDLLYHEQVDQQFIPVERKRTEVDLPTLIRYSLSHGRYGKIVYLVAVFCCILIVVAMSLASANSAKNIVREEYSWYFIVAIMLCVSFMNNLPFWTLQYIHIATMICRLAYCAMRIFVKLPENPDDGAGWLFVPCLVTAFFYQLSLPRVLADFDRKPEEHICMQRVVLIAASLVHAVLLYGLDAKLSTPRDGAWKDAFIILYSVSKVSAPQIYWHAMSRIIIAWHYEVDLERAESEHPWKVRAVQTFVHIPIYIVSLVFIYHKYDLFKHSFTYFVVMPIVGAVTYLALSYSHRFYSKELSQADTATHSPWLQVLEFLFAALFVVGVLNIYLIDPAGKEGGVLAISTVGTIFLAMFLWKLGSRLWE